jgi:hypothetical protein
MAYTLQLNKKTTITTGIDSDDTAIKLTSAVFTNFTADFLVIDYDNPTKLEVVKGDVTGTAVTVTGRGQEGTSAVAHDAGAKIAYVFVPTHYSDLISIVQTSNTDGWIDPLATHTYNDVDEVTIPAGGLTKYAVGDKYKANQSIPLSAYWPMEDKDDDIIPATVANIGTPTYAAGKFANALTLNGTDQALEITDAAVFKPTGAFTIGGWVKATASASDKAIFQSYSDNTNANGIRVAVVATTGKVEFIVANNSANPATTVSGSTDITGACHYVVVSYQSNHAKIFIYGVLDGSGYSATPSYAATNYVRIGCNNVSGSNINWYAGQIDDLFFINGHAVDQYWVAAKYAEDTAQTTANITATYQGYVTAVTDTLLTLTGGADYALYNGTITSPYYSHSNPVGFPQWFNYTPTFTGFSSDPVLTGTNYARFCINGRMCRMQSQMDNGTSNQTYFTMTLPVASAKAIDTECFRAVDNNVVGTAPGFGYASTGSATLSLSKDMSGAAWTNSGNKRAVNIRALYEI